MGDETPMNLDLNLGPVVHPSQDPEPESMNLEDWLDGPVREAIGHRTRARQRWRSVWRPVPIPVESRNIALELMGGSGLEMGEGSVAAGERERPTDVAKTCDNGSGYLEDEAVEKKDDVEKGNGDEGSFFDCNICLDLASDPVVTCCGHLFCWPCLYRWLHVHSDAKECPICKGEVTIKNVTPIYGRGNTTREAEEDSGLKIPHRPQARRIESWRQTLQRNAFTIPMEEMIRRLGSRFDLTQANPLLLPDSTRELPERNSSLLNRILTSRGMRREQNVLVLPSDAGGDSTQSSPTNSESGESRRLLSLLTRRSNRAAMQREQNVIPSDAGADSIQGGPTNSESGDSHRLSSLLARHESRRLSSLLARRSNRASTISNLTSALSSAERIVETYFRSQAAERNQEQPPAVDDRDSVSSIAAIIQSESQTVDTAVEIESTVSLSTSSSRRRSDSSRVSDMDSGDSRAPRRRRLH